MPKIRRRDLAPTLLDHLLERIRSREISADQLGELATWLDTEPEVSTGKWFKRFPGMIVCGEGELVKRFLRTGQAPHWWRTALTSRKCRESQTDPFCLPFLPSFF
jgi:hypothetical protein